MPIYGLYGGVTIFKLELLQQNFSLTNSMGPDIVMQDDHTITQHVRTFTLDDFT